MCGESSNNSTKTHQFSKFALGQPLPKFELPDHSSQQGMRKPLQVHQSLDGTREFLDVDVNQNFSPLKVNKGGPSGGLLSRIKKKEEALEKLNARISARQRTIFDPSGSPIPKNHWARVPRLAETPPRVGNSAVKIGNITPPTAAVAPAAAPNTDEKEPVVTAFLQGLSSPAAAEPPPPPAVSQSQVPPAPVPARPEPALALQCHTLGFPLARDMYASKINLVNGGIRGATGGGVPMDVAAMTRETERVLRGEASVVISNAMPSSYGWRADIFRPPPRKPGRSRGPLPGE